MQSLLGKNQMLGYSILLGMAVLHAATFCKIVLDHAVLLHRCSALSRHFATGAKGVGVVNAGSWSRERVPRCCHDSPLSRRLWNQDLVSLATLPWKESTYNSSKNVFLIDPAVLLLRCFGLSQHPVPGDKRARIVIDFSSKECLPCSCHDSTFIGRFRVD